VVCHTGQVRARIVSGGRDNRLDEVSELVPGFADPGGLPPTRRAGLT